MLYFLGLKFIKISLETKPQTCRIQHILRDKSSNTFSANNLSHYNQATVEKPQVNLEILLLDLASQITESTDDMIPVPVVFDDFKSCLE
ncbi:hypothetical protein L1887_30868 [Cichorium endivia]|nr:hypothetical protein L1887_30868 [Cichorium endivia]